VQVERKFLLMFSIVWSLVFINSLKIYKAYRTLNAIAAKSENYPLEVNTTNEPKNITTSDSNGIWRGVF